jgi:hypothetical protein
LQYSQSSCKKEFNKSQYHQKEEANTVVED